jgi:hypothetical protein
MKNTLRALACLLALTMTAAPAAAEVTRVDLAARHDILSGRTFGSSGAYELLTGKIHFAIDPANPKNKVIVDLDKAPRNAAGLVELTADLSILKPRDLNQGNGVALIDIVNRGRRTVLAGFNRAAPTNELTTEAELGDGLLLRQGFTIVWVGWEFDVPRRENTVRIEVPVAAGTATPVHGYFTPDARRNEFTVTDLNSYTPKDPASAANTLTVRDGMQGAATTIPRERWQLNGNVVTLEGGFEAGRTYELSYTASSAPIAGLGFAAVRDTAAWLKYASDSAAPSKYAYAFGSSQSGRFLRDFVYEGFNTDEKNRQVLDAVIANIAGAARLDLNARGATPTSLAQFTATSFPFADLRQRDPVSGAEEGELENIRAREHQPKIFYTNTGVEYWGGGRSAALIHTAADGSRDLMLPDNVRFYFMTGSQHGPAKFPSIATNGQQKENSNDYWFTLRALLVAMDKWVRDRVVPPASRYPRLADGTLVRAADLSFPNLPTVTSPRTLTAGGRDANHFIEKDGAPGTPLPLFVPQVDQDGNEVAGIRLPDIAVPLATFTGWNFRKPAIGAPNQLFPLMGSYIAFPATKSDRDRSKDPRLSIEERYPSRERYLALVQDVASALVRDRYVLPDDLPKLLEHAGDHYDLTTRRAVPSTR